MAKKRGKDERPKDKGTRRDAVDIPRVPGWVLPVLFGALTLWLFRAFVFSSQMLYGSDTLNAGGYIARALYAEQIKSGTFPLWSPKILGGTPFLDALSGGDSLYPPSVLLLLLLEPYRALGWKLVVHIFAAGFFMFGWARALKASRPAALVAGVAYMLAPMLVSFVRPGHDGKLFVMSLTPLLFWAVERHFVRPRARSVGSIGLVVALVLFTTHFQMAYFLFGAVGLYAIFRAVQVARGKDSSGGDDVGEAPEGPPRRRVSVAATRFALFLTAAVLGAAGAGVQLIPAVRYVTEFSRRTQTTQESAGEAGRAWSSSWSLHPEEAMDLLIPEFSGNNADGSAWTQNTYWGRNATRDNLPTAGIVILVLAAVAFVGPRRQAGLRWFFTGLGLLAFLFALGEHTPVWGLFYALVPGISLFRAPDMVMFLFVFSAGTLGTLGFDRILGARGEGADLGWSRPVKVLLGAAVFFWLLLFLAGSGALTSLWTSVVYRNVGDQQLQALAALRPFIVRGAFLSALLASGLAGLAWGVRRGSIAPVVLLVGTVGLVVVDQLRVDGSFIQVLDFQSWARPDPNIQALLDREKGSDEPYRLFDLIQDAQDVRPAMFGIDLAAGHHPNDLARYRELIGMVGSGMPRNLFNPNIRSLLNVRYILWPNWDPRLGQGPEVNIVSRTQVQGGRPYETLYADAGLPRARLVASAVVKSDSEDVDYMLSDDFDPETQVVLPEAPPIALDGGPVQGSVRWDEDTPNRLRLTVTSDRPALLVVADNWYPAWHASVDGTETPVLRAYHTLRAIPVSPGEHTVEMWYHSPMLLRSLWLSVAALLVLGLAMAFGGRSGEAGSKG